jgi:hypothetical protein
MKGIKDQEQDKKLFTGMMKKAMPKKVTAHLKGDIKEASKGIQKDKLFMKSIKSGQHSGRAH